MAKLIIHEDPGKETLRLLKSAVESERKRISESIKRTRQNLRHFEKKYGKSSPAAAGFTDGMVAEDLDGKDREYVQWKGEWEVYRSLKRDLDHLENLTYERR